MNRILLLSVLVMMACSQNGPEPPADLLEEEEMVEALVELNLIESVRSMHITAEKKNKVETEAFYNELWERTGIDKDRFLRSFDHYRSDPQRMSQLYEQVASQIKRREDLLNEKKRQEVEERDQR
ncbi:MAG: DUF4296 domain-containing protein [Flavobacteriales bacterium]|nr:DUF4296 domain-containing protein [Flavobacteriales bacterium]